MLSLARRLSRIVDIVSGCHQTLYTEEIQPTNCLIEAELLIEARAREHGRPRRHSRSHGHRRGTELAR
jgi:hypothetical protein